MWAIIPFGMVSFCSLAACPKPLLLQKAMSATCPPWLNIHHMPPAANRPHPTRSSQPRPRSSQKSWPQRHSQSSSYGHQAAPIHSCQLARSCQTCIQRRQTQAKKNKSVAKNAYLLPNPELIIPPTNTTGPPPRNIWAPALKRTLRWAAAFPRQPKKDKKQSQEL